MLVVADFTGSFHIVYVILSTILRTMEKDW